MCQLMISTTILNFYFIKYIEALEIYFNSTKSWIGVITQKLEITILFVSSIMVLTPISHEWLTLRKTKEIRKRVLIRTKLTVSLSPFDPSLYHQEYFVVFVTYQSYSIWIIILVTKIWSLKHVLESQILMEYSLHRIVQL